MPARQLRASAGDCPRHQRQYGFWWKIRRDFCLMPVALGRHAFFRRTSGAWVRANNGRVNEQMFKIRVGDAMLMQLFPDTLLAPARKPFIDAVPVPILFRKQAPLGSCTSEPEHGGEELATTPLRPDINFRAGA